MIKPIGRSKSVSPFRRLVADMMHFGQQVPAVTASRVMDLRPLRAAHAACVAAPAWTVVFARAYALLSRDNPVLRRAYLKWPWPRIYEHPHSVAAINIERRLPGEDVVLFCLIRGAENRSLAALDALVRKHKEAPVESLRSYQRAAQLGRVPSPLRRWFWWAALNVRGRRRCHNFGTFSLSSIASSGAGLVSTIPVLTSTLHYGLFDDQGRLDVRITFDHRVMDGAVVGRALVDLESLLNGEMVRELVPSYHAREAA
jgi:hypothetical protein